MADVGQLSPSKVEKFHIKILQKKKPSFPIGNKDRKYSCGTTLFAAFRGHLSNGANTPSALNAGTTSSDTQEMIPFPPALGGPFAAPLFASLSAVRNSLWMR